MSDKKVKKFKTVRTNIMSLEDFLAKDIVDQDFTVNTPEENVPKDSSNTIISIEGIFNPKDSKEEAEFLKNNENVINFDTDASPKNVKRGDTMYLTVLMQSDSQSSIPYKGILKIRVIDIYKGLGKLDSLLKKQKKK